MLTIMEDYKQSYFNEVGRTYENHVNKFIEYLRVIEKLDTPTKIDLYDVGDCIGHYMRLGKINYRASMESHLESVKNFYDYLSETGKVNDIFTQINYEKFKNEIVNKYNLSEGKEREIFSMQNIKEILSVLDEVIDTDNEICNGNGKMNKYIQRVVLRIFIKLTLIAPAKKSTICNLKIKDFSDDYRRVYVNGVEINIPNGLKRDIVNALRKAGTNSMKYKRDDCFFDYISINTFSMTKLNHWFCSFLKETDIIDISASKLTYELEPIMKTAIKAMVDRMVNPAIISIISGIKIASLESKYYDGSIKLEYKETLNQAVNWEIAKNEYYTYV